MNRMGARLIAVALFTMTFALPQSAFAGRVLYEQCFTSRGNATNGIKAALQAGGLFYSWSGYRVNETVVNRFNRCDPVLGVAPIFQGTNPQGQNASAVNPFANNVMIPLNGHLLFNSIRNNTALDEDATKTTLTMNGNDSGTKIGTANTRAQGDPQILITNEGTTSILLLEIIAQVGNSQDPLDPGIFFVPDGMQVTVLPTLQPPNNVIAPGDTALFTFPLGNANNWSFQYSYSSGDDTFMELLASSVPEVSSCFLLAISLASLAVFGRKKSRRGLGACRE